MAFTVVNPAGEVKRLTRGMPAQLGTLAAANQAVAFALPALKDVGQDNLVITVNGNLSASGYTLETSLDAGTSWANVPSLTSDVVVGTVDTPAVAAYRYNVSALAGALLRFGPTTYTSGSGVVFALVG